MRTNHVSSQSSPARQRQLAFVIPGIAAVIAVAAFYAARALGCDERGASVATMVAGALAVMALAAAR